MITYLTLPIKPYLKKRYGTFLALGVNEFLSRCSGGKSVFAINELHSFNSLKNREQQFLYDCKAFGIEYDDLWRDVDNLDSITGIIKNQILTGKITETEKFVSECECGAVDELTDNFKSIVHKRMVNKIGNKYFCKRCAGEVCIVKKRVLIKKSENEEMLAYSRIIPDGVGKEVRQLAVDHNLGEILISKKRSTGIEIEANSNIYNIDVDYFWPLYIILLNSRNNVITTTNHEIKQVLKVLEVTNSYQGGINACFIGLPYLLEDISEFNIENLVEKLDNIYKKKLFLIFTIGCKGMETAFNYGMWRFLYKISGLEAEKTYMKILEECSNIFEIEKYMNAIKTILNKELKFQRWIHENA